MFNRLSKNSAEKKSKGKYLTSKPPRTNQEPKISKLDDELNCYFKPHINQISAALVTRKTEDSQVKENRWDALYRLNLKQKLKLEEKKRIQEDQQKQAEEAEFNFQPTLVSKKRANQSQYIDH